MPQSEAPERIVAWRLGNFAVGHWASEKVYLAALEEIGIRTNKAKTYTDADIADAEIARLRARVAELEEAMRKIIDLPWEYPEGPQSVAMDAMRETP